MIGISSSGKESINSIVGEMFDNIALQFIGDIPKYKNAKRLLITSEPHFNLAHLFVQAMQNRSPNPIEQDVLRGLLESASGYVESLKSKTKSNVTERIDGLVKEAKFKQSKVDSSMIQEAIREEMGKARTHMQAIVESEATKLRNLGTLMDITKVATSLGDSDPTIFFVVVRDGVTCKECLRLHLMPNGEPRLWKFSQLKQGYHKRGEPNPSAFGLHPHCFTENNKLFTASGIYDFKELYKSQYAPVVTVDKRIQNKVHPENQYGAEIPGQVRFNRHIEGSKFLQATSVYDTGIQECLRITMSTGHELEVSIGHEMWVDDDLSGKKIRADELKIGDKIPLLSGESGFGEDSFEDLAELMGNLMGDGNICKQTAEWNFFGNDLPYGRILLEKSKKYCSARLGKKLNIRPPNNKYSVPHASFNSPVLGKIFKEQFNLSKKPRSVPKRLWKADKNTVSAFLRGLFAADGHVEVNGVVLSQNNLVFLKEIQFLLANFGLVSRIYTHGESCQKYITYNDGSTYLTNRKAAWRLYIGGIENMEYFHNNIGMGVHSKMEKLKQNIIAGQKEDKSRFSWRTCKVDSIEKIGKQQTYCLTEKMTNSVTVNGVVTGQCRCTLTYLSRGFGFKDGRLSYIRENFDAYSEQNS
jgi:intein/homing endonuclease